MTWQRNDPLLLELRLAQEDLRHAELGMQLMTPDQRLLALPGVSELACKMEQIELALE